MKPLIKTLIALTPVLGHTAFAKPLTLLEMLKARAPFDPKSAAVVMIDFQQEYTSGKLPLFGIQQVVNESAALLQWARENQIPVVHVYHDGQKTGVFDLRTEAGKPIPVLAPEPGENVVYKQIPNAFQGTKLEKILKSLNKKSIIFAGLMTHMCLDASVRAAFDLGFNPLVVTTTTTTRNLPGLNSETLSAEQLREATLVSLQDLIAVIEPNLAALKARFVE